MARTKRKINPVLAAAPNVPQRRIYKAGGYIRLSVEDSGKLGADTIEIQKMLIRSYVEKQQDMNLCAVYCDNGRTGTNFERPGFDRLMQDVRAGKIDCVVVKDLSRFGRNYLETGTYLERIFPFLDVRFVAVNDNFDTLTAERSRDGYIIPLKNIMNEAYSKDISRKICPALASKQEKGEFIGSWAPYGYRKCTDDHHRIEPDPETAPVLQEIFQWRLEGMSYVQIARCLNNRGTPSPAQYHYINGHIKSERYSKSPWYAGTIKNMLSNEVYLGHMIQGRKRSGFCEGQKQKHLPKDKWVIVRNTHEPLIDEEIFHTVQQIAQKKRSDYFQNLGRYDTEGTSRNILRGLIFCADCKRPLVRYKTANSSNLYYTYICQSHTDNPAACPKKYLHENQLKEMLWSTLKTELLLASGVETLASYYLTIPEVIDQRYAYESEIIAQKKVLSRTEMLYDSLFQNYADKLMTEQEYIEMRQQYRNDIEQAKIRLKELEAKYQEDRSIIAENPWLSACRPFYGISELTEDLAHTLIERVDVDSNNCISVVLRYQDKYNALLQILETDKSEVWI